MCTSIVCTIVADVQEWDDDDEGQRTANIHRERPAWALSCDGGPAAMALRGRCSSAGKRPGMTVRPVILCVNSGSLLPEGLRLYRCAAAAAKTVLADGAVERMDRLSRNSKHGDAQLGHESSTNNLIRRYRSLKETL